MHNANIFFGQREAWDYFAANGQDTVWRLWLESYTTMRILWQLYTFGDVV